MPAREYRLWMTDAPVDYDYGYTEVVDPFVGHTAYSRTIVRCVRIPVSHEDFQTGRYQSGFYFACTKDEWDGGKDKQIMGQKK